MLMKAQQEAQERKKGTERPVLVCGPASLAGFASFQLASMQEQQQHRPPSACLPASSMMPACLPVAGVVLFLSSEDGAPGGHPHDGLDLAAPHTHQPVVQVHRGVAPARHQHQLRPHQLAQHTHRLLNDQPTNHPQDDNNNRRRRKAVEVEREGGGGGRQGGPHSLTHSPAVGRSAGCRLLAGCYCWGETGLVLLLLSSSWKKKGW